MSSEAIPPFDLSRLEYARIDGPGVALAYMGDDKNHVRLSPRRILVSYPNDSLLRQKAPMESLLRSALLVLMDNATAEYTFITTFFSPDQNPVPVRKETPMSPPTAYGSPSPMVLDDETGTPAGALSATTPTSIATPLTVDTDSNPAQVYSLVRGATPQPHLPVQLSKEDQTALNAVWKQITDPAVEYTQVGILLCVLCLNLNASFLMSIPPTTLPFPARMNCSPGLCQVMHGINTPSYPSAHYDPSNGRCGERDSTAGLRSIGNCALHHEIADVARISEGHVGPRGSTQEVYR